VYEDEEAEEEENENFIKFKINYPEHEFEANNIATEEKIKLENNINIKDNNNDIYNFITKYKLSYYLTEEHYKEKDSENDSTEEKT